MIDSNIVDELKNFNIDFIAIKIVARKRSFLPDFKNKGQHLYQS